MSGLVVLMVDTKKTTLHSRLLKCLPNNLQQGLKLDHSSLKPLDYEQSLKRTCHSEGNAIKKATMQPHLKVGHFFKYLRLFIPYKTDTCPTGYEKLLCNL